MTRIIAALLIGCSVGACGGSPAAPSSTGPAPPSLVVNALRIGGNVALTSVGETSQLTATAVYSDGSEKDVSRETAWSSTQTSVVTVSSSGLVTVAAFGVATIVARYDTRTVSIAMRPTPAGTYVIAGWVREPGQGGLGGVTITDPATGTALQSGATGQYVLAALPQPEARLRFARDGYEPVEMTVTPANFDTEMQRIIRVRAGETLRPPQFAPNDLAYTVNGDRCFPCRMVRIVADTSSIVHLHITWTDVRVTLNLWANGAMTAGSTSELLGDVTVPAGESIVYLGMRQPVASVHLPFTIVATVGAP
jgi:hypothetical protein